MLDLLRLLLLSRGFFMLCLFVMFSHLIECKMKSDSFAQESLCVLNISNNNIDDIRDLAVLRGIQNFSAADNELHNLEVNIASSSFFCKCLKQAALQGFFSSVTEVDTG